MSIDIVIDIVKVIVIVNAIIVIVIVIAIVIVIVLVKFLLFDKNIILNQFIKERSLYYVIHYLISLLFLNQIINKIKYQYNLIEYKNE